LGEKLLTVVSHFPDDRFEVLSVEQFNVTIGLTESIPPGCSTENGRASLEVLLEPDFVVVDAIDIRFLQSIRVLPLVLPAEFSTDAPWHVSIRFDVSTAAAPSIDSSYYVTVGGYNTLPLVIGLEVSWHDRVGRCTTV
jgi:hypothetical protein